MRKYFFIFCFIGGMAVYAQEGIYMNQNVKLLKVENRAFLNIIDTITNYESKHLYDPITNARSYIIDYSIFYDDTTVTIQSIYLKDLDTSLVQSLYGVYMHNFHWVFIKQKFKTNFIQSDSVITFEIPIEEMITFDGSVTEWNFRLKKGKLIYQWCRGASLDEKYYKIDIIEENVEDFPD